MDNIEKSNLIFSHQILIQLILEDERSSCKAALYFPKKKISAPFFAFNIIFVLMKEQNNLILIDSICKYVK